MKYSALAKSSKTIKTKAPLSSPQVLPPSTTKRWVASRKAAVVAAVQGAALTVEEACRLYQLSREEFQEWQRHYEAEGLSGLRASTRLHRSNYSVH